jgi:hypothetical protein
MVAAYGVLHGRMFSPIGRNAFHCTSRYGFDAVDISKISRRYIVQHVHGNITDDLALKASFLLELMYIRGGTYELPSGSVDKAEISAIINYLCTS